MTKAKKRNAAKVAKVKKDSAKTTQSVFLYNNTKKGELDLVQVNLNGKDKALAALTSHDLDINSLKLSELVKTFYMGFDAAKIPSIRLALKNVYGIAFGFAIPRPSSYKCAIAHHTANGLSALVYNQCGLFTIASINEAFDKVGVPTQKYATYSVVNLTKENLAKVTKATKALLKVK